MLEADADPALALAVAWLCRVDANVDDDVDGFPADGTNAEEEALLRDCSPAVRLDAREDLSGDKASPGLARLLSAVTLEFM